MRFLALAVLLASFGVSWAQAPVPAPKIENKPATVKDGLPRIPPTMIPGDAPAPAKTAAPAPQVITVVKIVDPTDGGEFQCPVELVDAVNAHIAAKVSGKVPAITATCSGPNCSAPVIAPAAPQAGSYRGNFLRPFVQVQGSCSNGQCPKR